MRKPFLFIFALFICLGTISDALSQTKPVEDEGVQDVILDRTEATLACPGVISKSGICNEEARKIKISTFAKDAEKKDLTYYYLITGGKIIGNGKDVVWDFTNAKPGNYSITVGVGKDGILKGNFITKNVTVRDCECDPGYECPSISVTGPTVPADAGDTLIFTVDVKGGSQDIVIYKWTISAGEIVEGQGTSHVLVKTSPELKGHAITATVDIGGIGEPSCPRNASASAEIKDK
jgi:hypothetical protein